MVLYVNAAPRENSRTRKLAEAVLTHYQNEEIEEIRLFDTDFPRLDESFLRFRDGCVTKKDFSDKTFDLAKQFARAEVVVIAAPYYDLSFPSALKQYFEQINVIGLTFAYDENGNCYSLCRLKTLHYCMTVGGKPYGPDCAYPYVCSLAEYFYNNPKCYLHKVERLDIEPGAEEKNAKAIEMILSEKY